MRDFHSRLHEAYSMEASRLNSSRQNDASLAGCALFESPLKSCLELEGKTSTSGPALLSRSIFSHSR